MPRQVSDVVRNRSNPLGNSVVRVAAAAVLMGGLAACSLMPDWSKPSTVYGDTAAAPTQEGTEGFPNLADTPDQKPASTSPADQKTIAEGLAADRASARHSDEVLRGGTEPPAPPPQVAAPSPVPALKDVPADAVDPEAAPDAPRTNDKKSELLPMPGIGGHATLAAARRVQTAAADISKEASATTGDDAEAKPNPEAEQPINAAPTTPVEVKPAVDGGKAM